MLNQSLEAFTAEIASAAPVPGGGGASALVGAIGIALGDMVGELTVGKKKYADVEEAMRGWMAEAQQLRVALLKCIEKDAAGFEPLSRAYGIPRDDPERDHIMEACLKEAAAAPVEMLELCGKAIGLLRAFADHGSRLMISDAATGAAICRGAMQGAAINVKVNTRLMKDRETAESMNRHVDELLEKWLPEADRIYEEIYGRYC